MLSTHGYAATGPTSPLAPFRFERRDPGPRDVVIDIDWCGVCHSDIHTARGEWGGTVYPVVPGHEIIGRVAARGADVRAFAVGQRVGVGCMVGSCRRCRSCEEGLEQYCEGGGLKWTYNSLEDDGRTPTYGGYSKRIVVAEDFVLRIPEGLDPAGAAPLLCAGVTTWSPLEHWKVGPGQRVGVVGLGGLGHMGVKLARARGATVVVFTTSPGKRADAERLGAHEVVLSRDEEAMRAQRGRFDFVLDTVSADHDVDQLTALLKRDGTLVLVGLPEKKLPVSAFNLVGGRRRLAGSLIGGIRETQAMLDFCGEHGITSDVEVIPIQKINEAYERTVKGDVKYRFVIDLRSLEA